METNRCLNCGAETSGKFCANCGQKTDTHRITLKHFLAHDLVHGFWHLDRGILFTIKEALIRPGKAALDYISGKRIRYYNVFYLSLLLIALNVVLWNAVDKMYWKDPTREDSELVDLMGRYLKIFVFCVVPLLAVNGRAVFTRLKLNLTEHFIIGGFSLVGILLMSLIFILSYFLELMADSLSVIKLIAAFLMTIYPIWTYGNATKGLYRFGGFIWRALLFQVLLLVEAIFLMLMLSYFFTSDSGLDINL